MKRLENDALKWHGLNIHEYNRVAIAKFEETYDWCRRKDSAAAKNLEGKSVVVVFGDVDPYAA